jgi:hypothetical protein
VDENAAPLDGRPKAAAVGGRRGRSRLLFVEPAGGVGESAAARALEADALDDVHCKKM